MKRVVLMALLMLALPVAAWASSIDISNSNGTITGGASGLQTSTASTLNKFGSIIGSNLGTLSFSTGAFTSGDAQMGGTIAAGGMFTITGNGTSGVPNGAIFTGSFSGPVDWKLITLADGSHNYTLSGAISGTWYTGATVVGATTQITLNTGKDFFNGTVDISSGNTNIVVPEPGTLGLLGTGLVGIAGLVRRKLSMS